jgi:hypothetical protein
MDEQHTSGGSRVLIELIEEHADAVVGDLLHYYNVDVRDLFREVSPYSPRYILVLVSQLPLGSAYVAEQRGGSQFRGWDHALYAQVALINAVRTSNYMFLCANSDPKKKKPEAPDPYPTPDEPSEPRGRGRRGPPAPGSFVATAAAMISRARKAKKNG